MNTLEQTPKPVLLQSARARLSVPKQRPFFIVDWLEALFLHFEIEPRQLQPHVPFELDLWEGRAFVSLVAFTMRGMRLAPLGKLGAWLCRPIATHPFLNCRTYVRHQGEPGICFLSEWLTNRLSVLCGPALYSLPYRRAAISYDRVGRELSGRVSTPVGEFAYAGELKDEAFAKCSDGSLDEFLIERYAAFNAGHSARSVRRLFRVEHKPWRQAPVQVRVLEDTLLRATFPWWAQSRFVGANYSSGVRDVAMSAPRRIA